MPREPNLKDVEIYPPIVILLLRFKQYKKTDIIYVGGWKNY